MSDALLVNAAGIAFYTDDVNNAPSTKAVETITDTLICELAIESIKAGDYHTAMWCDYALMAADQSACFVPMGCERDAARAHCAKFINQRATEPKE